MYTEPTCTPRPCTVYSIRPCEPASLNAQAAVSVLSKIGISKVTSPQKGSPISLLFFKEEHFLLPSTRRPKTGVTYFIFDPSKGYLTQKKKWTQQMRTPTWREQLGTTHRKTFILMNNNLTIHRRWLAVNHNPKMTSPRGSPQWKIKQTCSRALLHPAYLVKCKLT